MPDLDFVKVIGRLGLVVGDGVADPDQNPDTQWCDSGEVWFTPLNSVTKVVGSAPVPATLGQSTIKVPIDSSGYLSYSGTKAVWLVDLTSTKVNPSVEAGKATHRVEFKNIKSQGVEVSFAGFSGRFASDTVNLNGACDLTLLSPVPVSAGTAVVVGPRGASVTSMRVLNGSLLYTVQGLGEQNAGVLPQSDLLEQPSDLIAVKALFDSYPYIPEPPFVPQIAG